MHQKDNRIWMFSEVVEDDELVGAQGECGVRATVVIAELDLEDAGSKRLHDGPDLAPAESPLRQFFKQRNDGEGFDGFHIHSKDITAGHAGEVLSAQHDPTAADGPRPLRASQFKV